MLCQYLTQSHERLLSRRHRAASPVDQLKIVVPVIEKEAFSHSLVKTTIFAFLLMVFIFFLSTRLMSRQLWRSLYSALAAIKQFDLDMRGKLELMPTRIAEFNELNEVLMELVSKSKAAFVNQKQFIENASHELQTPLAINQNKLEQLADDPDLTAAQSLIVQTLISSTRRMTRLNKTLLLLSKIDNTQFPETELILLCPLVVENINLFDDLQSQHHIAISTSLDEKVCLKANRALTELLVTNLIKNAFVHNMQGGK